MTAHYFAGVGAGLLLQMAATKLIPENYDGWIIAAAVVMMTYVIVRKPTS